jgi:hypothetical protein
MARADRYVTIPLAWIRLCNSPLDFFERGIHFAAREAGLGLRQKEPGHFEHRVAEFLAEHDLNHEIESEEIDAPSIAGWSLLQFKSPDPTGQTTARIHKILDAIIPPEKISPRFRVSWSIFHTSWETQRFEAGHIEEPPRQISWREFRILLALLSIRNKPWNRNKIEFEASAQDIRVQSCGFTKNENLQKAQSFPEHAAPFSRDQIERTMGNLDKLGFFHRRKVSKGKCGGLWKYRIGT